MILIRTPLYYSQFVELSIYVRSRFQGSRWMIDIAILDDSPIDCPPMRRDPRAPGVSSSGRPLFAGSVHGHPASPAYQSDGPHQIHSIFCIWFSACIAVSEVPKPTPLFDPCFSREEVPCAAYLDDLLAAASRGGGRHGEHRCPRGELPSVFGTSTFPTAPTMSLCPHSLDIDLRD